MSRQPPDGPGPRGDNPRQDRQDRQDQRNQQGTSDHDIGSVSEEAAKLLGALGDWAKDHGQGYAGAAAAGAAGVAEAMREVDRHLATGAEECRYCPLCVIVAKVRATSPEVRQHLSTATTSLLAAVAGMLATPVSDDEGRRGPVEKIDLSQDDRDAGGGGGGMGPRLAEEPAGSEGAAAHEDAEAPWWASPGARPHDEPSIAHDEAGHGLDAGFEDLAAPTRQRRTRRPCTDEEEPR